MQIVTFVTENTVRLKKSGCESARLDAELLVGFVLAKSRTWVHSHPEYTFADTEEATLNALLQRRTNHEPLAYILGTKEFYGRDFIVNKEVLVPRPESEDLIAITKSISVKNAEYIDIGTGSGVLAITIALEQPTWSGTATDISLKALKVAQKNAQNFKIKNLVFIHQNLLANDSKNYDVIIANLPYVPQNLRSKPDIAHEPEIALFADNDSLALYEELFQQIANRQHKPVHIITESLPTQHQDLEKMAIGAGYSLFETKGLIQHFLVG